MGSILAMTSKMIDGRKKFPAEVKAPVQGLLVQPRGWEDSQGNPPPLCPCAGRCTSGVSMPEGRLLP